MLRSVWLPVSSTWIWLKCRDAGPLILFSSIVQFSRNVVWFSVAASLTIATYTKIFISLWQLFDIFLTTFWWLQSIKMCELGAAEFISAVLVFQRMTTSPLILLAFWLTSFYGNLKKVVEKTSKKLSQTNQQLCPSGDGSTRGKVMVFLLSQLSIASSYRYSSSFIYHFTTHRLIFECAHWTKRITW